MLASLLYPYDDDAPELIDGWLEELETQEHVRRYSVEGHVYLEVVNFLEHQKIDRPSKSRLPSFDEHSRVIDEDSTSPRPSRALPSPPIPSSPIQIPSGANAREEASVSPGANGELMSATWLLEELGCVADNGIVRVVAEAMRLLAKEGGTIQTAAEYILAAGHRARADGEIINRFWFTDQKYRPQKPRKTARQKRIAEWEPSNDG